MFSISKKHDLTFRYLFCSVLLISCINTVFGQQATQRLPYPLVNYQKDTSFTNRSAYLKTLKTHPHISWPNTESDLKLHILKNVVYKTIRQPAGTLNLQYDAYLPKQGKAKAAIIIVHGGGWRSGSRQQHEALAVALANRGYACFNIDYRLSTHALFPAAVVDVHDAIKLIRKNARRYNFSPNQIALMGYSAGGALSALVSTGTFAQTPKSTQLPDALIDVDGVLAFIHPDSGEGDESKGPSAATLWFGATKVDNPAIWQKASALNGVQNAQTPTLFINSGVKRMQAGQAEFLDNLKKRNIATEVVSFQDAPHTFVLFEPWFSPIVEACDKFLTQIFRSDRKEE